jgi:hypothetical protein
MKSLNNEDKFYKAYIIFLLIIYITLPILYLFKVLVMILEIMGIVEQCKCENMLEEKFYFTEKILGTSIVMIIIILIISAI